MRIINTVLVCGLTAMAVGCASPSYDFAPADETSVAPAMVSHGDRARIEVLPVLDEFPARPEFQIQIVNLDNEAHVFEPDYVTVRVNGTPHPTRSFADLRQEIEYRAEVERERLLAESNNPDQPEHEAGFYSSMATASLANPYVSQNTLVQRMAPGRTWVSQQHQLDRIESQLTRDLSVLQATIMHSAVLEPSDRMTGQIVCEQASRPAEPLNVELDVRFAGEVHTFSFVISETDSQSGWQQTMTRWLDRL